LFIRHAFIIDSIIISDERCRYLIQGRDPPKHRLSCLIQPPQPPLNSKTQPSYPA